MNVLVYSGPGTTSESVKHCLESLRLHLSPSYAVVAVSETAILNDPWMHKTAVFVMPGGADLPMCKVLNGEGNKKISQFVKKGGKYIGFCAGGYYASERCEFEVGTNMEITGPRELSFFPGIDRGCAYKGFLYETHKGVRSTPLQTENGLVYNYYNGGGVFVNASKYSNTEVLATYTEPVEVTHNASDDELTAAVVLCKVGKGAALLTGSHPEYTPALMKPGSDESDYIKTFKTLSQPDNEEKRKIFLRDCLGKLGLKVNQDVNMSVPHLTPIYLSSLKPDVLCQLRQSLHIEGTNHKHEDANDTFIFHTEEENDNDYFIKSSEEITNLHDLESQPKHIKISNELPSHKITPYFNMATYREEYKKLSNSKIGGIGSTFGYCEVITSTNTIMDKNPGWLRHLPHGFAVTATTQVSGRGRGGNVWINPKGVMATSVLFKVPVSSPNKTSIVTLQYLCGLAIVELILSYGSDEPGKGVGYEEMPIKLKWPNDIYSMKPQYFNDTSSSNTITSSSTTLDEDEEKYAKISGALINSQYMENCFYLVWGVGINVSNSAPTTSLNIVLDKLNEIRLKKGLSPLPPYQHELLLAKMLHTVEEFYNVFAKAGLKPFLPLYYKRWLHSDQIVDVDANGDGSRRKCLIKGITPEYGLLVVEDVKSGEILELQPDGNSFDIFRGLIYKKN